MRKRLSHFKEFWQQLKSDFICR